MENTPEIMNVLMTYVGALSALRTNVPAPVIPLKAVLVSNNSSTTFCFGFSFAVPYDWLLNPPIYFINMYDSTKNQI